MELIISMIQLTEPGSFGEYLRSPQLLVEKILILLFVVVCTCS